MTFSLAPNTMSEGVGLKFHLYCQIGLVDAFSVGLYLKIKALMAFKCVPTANAAVPAELISKDPMLASSEYRVVSYVREDNRSPFIELYTWKYSVPEEAGANSPINQCPLGLKLIVSVVCPAFDVSAFIHRISLVDIL